MKQAIFAAGLLALAGCTSGPKLTGDGVFALASADPKHPRLRYADGQVSMNESCMIKLGNKLNPKIPPFYLNGTPVGFCSVPCPDVFVQDVAEYVRRKGLALAGYFDPSRPAVIDDDHLARVNYESYFFADTEGRALFLEDPIRYCGLVTDPVTKHRFRPGPTSPSAEHEGVVYYFESSAHRRAFERMPADFVRPGYRM